MKVQLIGFVIELYRLQSSVFQSQCAGIIVCEGPELNQTIAFTSSKPET